MVTRRDPLQVLKEAKQIAIDHRMRVVEHKTRAGTEYIVYRMLPDGRDTRLGKRSTPAGLRRFVAACAGYH